MINTAKYFVLLENLRFEQEKSSSSDRSASAETATQRIIHNLSVLEKYVKLDLTQQLHELSTALRLEEIKLNHENVVDCYIVRLMHALHALTSNIKFDSDAKEDLISVAHLKLCIQAAQELAYHALRCQLPADFYNSPVFKQAQGVASPNPSLLLLSVEFFARQLLPIRQLHIANAMEFVLRDLMAAAIGLQCQAPEQRAFLQNTLTHLWQHTTKTDVFRNVLLLKATPNLSQELAKELHQLLLGQLNAPQGFASLVATLQMCGEAHAEIVANIVARRGYAAQTQRQMIEQIFEFCRRSLGQANSLSAAVLSLRRLYELNDGNRQSIRQALAKDWQPLTAPEDLVSGLIVMEQQELSERIALWQQLFCSSNVACLPSELLVTYLPLLLQLYEGANAALAARRQLGALVARCLDNRETGAELPKLIESLLRAEWSSEALHGRLLLEPTQFVVKVAPAEGAKAELDMAGLLAELLMASPEALALSCKVFMIMLDLLARQLSLEGPKQTDIELLATETELATFLHGKYQLQLQLLMALNTLIAQQALRAQLAGSGKQLLRLLRLLLQRRSNGHSEGETADQTLLLVLTLVQELLQRSDDLARSMRELRAQLEQLEQQTHSQLVQQRVQMLLQLIDGGSTSGTDDFERARQLMEQSESHVQVCGLQMLLQLLRQRDAATLAQGHLIVALALALLKSKESYTFLNCVRLFVALTHTMEAEVLEKLSDEYLSEAAELDYRLVVGEAILQAAKELGPLCYKYKDVLLNCFMHGARSPVDDLRMSAYANLAQLCRLLAFQVHGFFQELLQLVDAELSTGSYLPAKRAAVLVLAQLLEGMDSLLDYEELLLPIYRLLRTLESSESCDAQIRLHAANGLSTLNAKCRQLLSAPPQLHKEIKVLGIKDKPPRSKPHILELN